MNAHVWLIGHKGMLGHEVASRLKQSGLSFHATDMDCDITNPADFGASGIHVSTDYVFDDTASEPYQPDHPTSHEDRPGFDHRYAIDCSRIKDEIGWRQNHDFASGSSETVMWYLSNPAWIQSIQAGAYREWIAANYEQLNRG